jgi:hypothetical protein
VEGEQLALRGMISDLNGLTLLRDERRGAMHTPELLGTGLAEALLQGGGAAILRDIYGSVRTSGAGNHP